MVAETACFHDTIQRFYTDDGHGDGRLAFRNSSEENIFALLESITNSGDDTAASLYANDAVAMLMLPAANMVVASRHDMTKMYEASVHSAVAKIGTPLWEEQPTPAPDDELLSDKAGPIDRYRYLFVRLFAPAHDTLRSRIAKFAGERDGVLVGLALESFRREHQSLAQDARRAFATMACRWCPSIGSPASRCDTRLLTTDRSCIASESTATTTVGMRRPALRRSQTWTWRRRCI